MKDRIRLLWYNTFLLPGVEVSPILVGLVLEHLASMTLLGRALTRQTQRLLRPLRNLAERPLLTLGQKPELEPRAAELGEVLADLLRREDADATIVALAEVFAPTTRRTLLQALDELDIQAVSGPPAGFDGISGEVPDWLPPMIRHECLPLSGGLLALAGNLPIRRCSSEAFRFMSRNEDHSSLLFLSRGHPIRDPDFWSNKGILFTELELNQKTAIELYTTHLFSGHVIGEALWMGLQRLGYRQPGLLSLVEKILGLPFAPTLGQRLERYHHYFALPEERRLEIQRAQLRQLVDFILRHHRPENLVILAGDFNLDAHEPAQRDLLTSELSRLVDAGIELDEPWTSAVARPPGTVLHLDQLYGPQPADEMPMETVTEHIDYLFIERPRPEHALELTLEAFQRRAFPRAPQSPGMNYLSDHIGLEVTLRVSPKPRR